jgi:hypothetical protein
MTIAFVFQSAERTAFIEWTIDGRHCPTAEGAPEYPESSRRQVDFGAPLARRGQQNGACNQNQQKSNRHAHARRGCFAHGGESEDRAKEDNAEKSG